jgi:hypothetical protein
MTGGEGFFFFFFVTPRHWVIWYMTQHRIPEKRRLRLFHCGNLKTRILVRMSKYKRNISHFWAGDICSEIRDLKVYQDLFLQQLKQSQIGLNNIKESVWNIRVLHWRSFRVFWVFKTLQIIFPRNWLGQRCSLFRQFGSSRTVECRENLLIRKVTVCSECLYILYVSRT